MPPNSASARTRPRRTRPDRSPPRQTSTAVVFATIALAVLAGGCRLDTRPAAGPSNPSAAPGSSAPAVESSPIPLDLRTHLTPWDRSVPVTWVIDGDTIRVETAQGRSESVRLIGLNAPETGDGRRAVQCFGREATARLTELIGESEVWLAGDPTESERDRYGRLLAYAWLPDGTLLNQSLIAEGYANEATFDGPYVLRDTFRAAAAAARRADRGLWAPDTCDGDYDAPPQR
jgi:micrococcal nuclease